MDNKLFLRPLVNSVAAVYIAMRAIPTSQKMLERTLCSFRLFNNSAALKSQRISYGWERW